ncbi:MAG: hypothetical protein IPM35_38085 [Myxococcales bacterium]|nr:hypothetical protein [Myxococcales bacterium]
MTGKLFVIALATLIGCSSSTTNTGSGGGGGAAGAGGSSGAGTGGAPACADGGNICALDPGQCCQCSAGQCAQEVSTCLCDNSCVEALVCGFACDGGAGCVDGCGKGNPAFVALRACASAKCGAECN